MHGDIVATARVLLTFAEALRRPHCRRMIEQADAAHRFFKKLGRSHPLWGDGSLMTLAYRRPMRPEPGFGSTDYCSCVEMVLHEIIRWRLDRDVSRSRN